ncbi:MAG: tRNA (guanosine(46)-N7)-methyltransferase TrmB [Methylococcus sp.]|nr:MAG: tRNA (guanosine(46)-N7)-methyltransferase TrmB [Methylococcus sp.]
MCAEKKIDRRRVLSFVRRRGRITPSQEKALKDLWPVYGVEPHEPFNGEKLFGNLASVTLEIGFGNGSSLAAAAQKNPQRNYVGVEVHEPGVGHLMNLLDKGGIGNVRIFCQDAVEVVRDLIQDAALDRVNLFFPDPWPKKRHHKRRIVSPDFAELVSVKLRQGGCFHIATDWDEYACHITDTLEGCKNFERIDGKIYHQLRLEDRSTTRFEKRGLLLGHPVRDILYAKI